MVSTEEPEMIDSARLGKFPHARLRVREISCCLMTDDIHF
jgi:hypothetical protein